MKFFKLPTIHCALLFIGFFLFSCKPNIDNLPFAVRKTEPTLDIENIKSKAQEALNYCQSQQLNEDFCILIDMSIHSGSERFFVYSFKVDSVIFSCPVSHGCCNKVWGMALSKENPTFSNEDGSHCSSLGKYKIGERGYSQWGIHVKYLLHGLESTNINALSRTIVLHSWEDVSDQSIYPNGTPEGWGCPAVSNNSMLKIDNYLKDVSNPVLMWVYI